MKNILIIAAENSAENYGIEVIKHFKKSKFQVTFFGAGGEKFKRNGVDIVVHNKELSIVGIVEVISSIFKLKRIMDKIVRISRERKADAALLIDYPDFNLRLAKKLKKAGIPVYYYISPTVWAWRYSRVKLIKKYIDHMFIIFPFEIDIYKKEKIPFTYTGHPMIPLINEPSNSELFRKKYNVNKDEKVLTLLPGSRISEVDSLLPEMLKTVSLLTGKFKLKVFLLKADNIDKEIFNNILKLAKTDITLISQSDRYDLLGISDVALASCGTSNLEIAISGTPFAAVYRVNSISYFLGKRFLKISLYSIVNILLGKKVVDEFIQNNFSAENCYNSISEILSDKRVANHQKEEFNKLKGILSEKNSPSEIIFKKLVSFIS